MNFIFSNETVIPHNNKPAKLVAQWMDLAAWYDDGETAWKFQNNTFVNCGDTQEFLNRFKNGHYRGELIN